MLKGMAGGRNEDEVMAKFARQVPLGRIAEVEEIAGAVLYLAADESRMMTGAELKLDGGLSAM
jgi:NAD(P)-dependent dehydrogenase (short-subunit alcohol dehydrogenase family)